MKISIYSPGASDYMGHPEMGQRICYYLSKNIDTVMIYTLENRELNKKLSDVGAIVKIDKKFRSGTLEKKYFLKYGIFQNLIFGINKIYSNYKMIQSFIAKSKNYDKLLILEFEYFSIFLVWLLNKKLFKDKIILNFHSVNFNWLSNSSILLKFYKATVKNLIKIVVSNTYKISIHGNTLRNKFLKDFNITPDQKYKIFISGYGFDMIKSKSNKLINPFKSLSLDSDKKYILLFGVLRKDKGIIEVIENFNKINTEYYLLIAGSEWDLKETQINDLIKKNNIEKRVIKHIKYIKEENIEYYYNVSEIILIPHKNGFYSFSGPLALAAKYKKHVLSSDLGEIGYFTNRYGLGKTFKVENWQDFTFQLNNLISDIDKSNMKLNNNFYTQYTWENIVNRILKNL